MSEWEGTSFVDGSGNYLMFECKRDSMHLYFDIDGEKYEVISATVNLLPKLKYALEKMDLNTIKPR